MLDVEDVPIEKELQYEDQHVPEVFRKQNLKSRRLGGSKQPCGKGGLHLLVPQGVDEGPEGNADQNGDRKCQGPEQRHSLNLDLSEISKTEIHLKKKSTKSCTDFGRRTS